MDVGNERTCDVQEIKCDVCVSGAVHVYLRMIVHVYLRKQRSVQISGFIPFSECILCECKLQLFHFH
jgi:hypothetical protein